MTSDREHVTRADIEKFSRRELAPPDILRVARHLGECADCATRARELVTADDVEDAFGFDEIAHPDVEPELAAYLRSQPAELPRRSPRTTFIATALAAAAAAVFVTIALLNRSPAPAPAPSHPIARRPIAITPAPTTGYGRSDWDDAVADAVRNHGIAAPSILRDVRESPDILRGAGAAADAVKVSLSPAGVVIDDTTPRFTWTAFKGAKYVVEVFAGEIPVTSSGPLASNEWMPPKPLKRGKTYTWQVAVRRGETSTIVPAPPLPAALFSIVDEKTSAELADAKRRFPGDHLLLGVLAARAGLQQQAENELRASRSPAAAAILESIRRW